MSNKKQRNRQRSYMFSCLKTFPLRDFCEFKKEVIGEFITISGQKRHGKSQAEKELLRRLRNPRLNGLATKLFILDENRSMKERAFKSLPRGISL